MNLPDIRLAFAYHPLFFTVPFIPLLAAAKARLRNTGAIAMIILFITVWTVRMIFLFPDQAPMIYNENSLIEILRRGQESGRPF